MIVKFSLVIAGIIVLAGALLVFRIIRRGTFFTVAGLAMLFLALVGIKLMQFAAMAATPWVQPPDVVTTATADQQVWTPTVDEVGSLAAVQGVTLATELDGKVARISFDSGSSVHAGDTLVQLDVSSEEAQLRSAQAAADLAHISLNRARQLLTSQTISQADFDSADAQSKQADANVDDIRSVIEKKTIRAPFDGRAGIRLVNLGETLKAGTQVVSLQSLDPIYANFLVPQQNFSQIATGLSVRVQTDALPDRTVTGRITAINPDVDDATRNFLVQATLPNSDQCLRPGMFAQVSVQLSQREKVLVIPATSVLYAPYGDSVFIVDQKKSADGSPASNVLRQQFVRLGDRRGDFVAVTRGLNPGDEVVTTGVFKLRPGESVIINNAASPHFQIDPHPDNS
jgi:membrane fusion protein (multidrug efflux system)